MDTCYWLNIPEDDEISFITIYYSESDSSYYNNINKLEITTEKWQSLGVGSFDYDAKEEILFGLSYTGKFYGFLGKSTVNSMQSLGTINFDEDCLDK